MNNESDKTSSAGEPAELGCVPLTDAEIRNAGFRTVSAFVREEKSKNAIRVAKSRSKAEESGLKQLNVRAHPDIHDVLKEIAKRTAKQPNLLLDTLRDIANSKHAGREEDLAVPVTFGQHDKFEREAYQLGMRLRLLTGWRRYLLMRLGILS